MSKEQLDKAKERMKQLEKRDEEKVKTDKAKNDFESIIYAMRDWINEEHNQPFIAGGVDDLLGQLTSEEDWLMDEGDRSTHHEYNRRYEALNKELSAFKNRKQEHSERDETVEGAL